MNRTASERKRRLRESGHTVQALADACVPCVSWRMAKYWMDDEKTSANVAGAFDRLTAGSTYARSATPRKKEHAA